MNVIYMVLDDTGFSDLGCYGSEIRTPHMDRLARGGLRYNEFCATPLCSPTRASLLTGRNHHAVGMGSVAGLDMGPEFPHTRGRITPAAATIAQVLQEQGFGTFAVGKWHLGPTHQATPAGSFADWPLRKGFDRFYGFLEGSTDQFKPYLVYDQHFVDPPQKEDYHLSEDLTDHAIQFMTDHISIYPDRPFFLYFAFGAQHAPHQVHPSYMEQYRGMYDPGWDQIRQARYERQKKRGIIPEHAELAPRNPGVKAWSELSADEKKLFVRFQETYAGFLTHADEQVGRLLAFLEKTRRLDQTLIVLLSDNGGSQEGGFNGSINQSSHFNFMEETVEEQVIRLDEIGSSATSPNYPKGWAQVSNTPFQQYKQNTHFGGIRVPLIFHWPDGIDAQGEIRSQFHHVVDITPTVLDLLQIQPPETYHGIAQMPIHGTSMAYSFTDPEAPSARTTQYFLTKGHRAIISNGWKAVTLHKKNQSFDEEPWELYHIENDFSEVHNVADQYPDKLAELKQLWMKEAATYGALPLTDRTMNSYGYTSPDSPANRKHFEYYAGMGRIGFGAVPPFINQSYTITVPVGRASIRQEGVLVAAGNHNSGFTLYIKDNRLIHEYNSVGTRYTLVSGKEVPTGEVVLRFVFEKTGTHVGTGRLFINEELTGEIAMERTIPNRLSHQGLDIGRDSLQKVSKNYPSDDDFPFTGRLDSVRIDIES